MLSHLPSRIPQEFQHPQNKGIDVGARTRRADKERDERKNIAEIRVPQSVLQRGMPLDVIFPINLPPALGEYHSIGAPGTPGLEYSGIIDSPETRGLVHGHAPFTPTKRKPPPAHSYSPFHLLYPSTPELKPKEIEGEEGEESSVEQHEGEPFSSIPWGSQNPEGELSQADKAELKAIWTADPLKRLPTLASRYSWARTRGVYPPYVQQWFHRRRWRKKTKATEQYDITRVKVTEQDGVYTATFPADMLPKPERIKIKIRIPPHMRRKLITSNDAIEPSSSEPLSSPQMPLFEGRREDCLLRDDSPLTSLGSLRGSRSPEHERLSPVAGKDPGVQLVPSLQSIRNITRLTSWSKSPSIPYIPQRVPTPPWR